MPGASYPKADAERRTRHPPAFGWAVLAPKHRLNAPALPKGRSWRPETVAWWRELWRRPQAVMWDPSGLSLHGAARIYDRIVTDGTSVPLEAELRQHYDRHGLSPKAMLQLRWRVGDPGELDEVASVRRADDARRRRLLRALRDEETG